MKALRHILLSRVDLTINRKADLLRQIVLTLQVGLTLVGNRPISQDVKLLLRFHRLGFEGVFASLLLKTVLLRLWGVSS